MATSPRGVTTRSTAATTKIEELEQQVAALTSQLQFATARDELRRATPVVDALASAGDPGATEEQQRLQVSADRGLVQRNEAPSRLRAPNLEKFSGDREKTEDFLLAMDRRLRATGQADSLFGMDFAVDHLTGFAATWYRCYSRLHPEVQSWNELRPALATEFEMVAERKIFEVCLMSCKQTDTVEVYAQEFLDIRLPHMDDGTGSCRISMRAMLAGHQGVRLPAGHPGLL